MRFRGLQATNGPVVVPYHVATHPSLSMKAKGLFLVMLSASQGEHLTVTGLLERVSDKRDAVTAAWRELVEAGLLVEVDGWLELRETPKTPQREITGNPKITGNPELRETPKKPLANSGKTRTARVPHTVVVSSGRSTSESKSTEGDSASDLFGLVDVQARSRLSKFANNPLHDQSVFESVFKNEALAGVDLEHYRTAIRRWSDKKPRRLHDFDGWRAVLEGAMVRDRDTGKLRMIGQHGEAESRQEAELEFLKLGR